MKIAIDGQIFFFEKRGGISRYFTSLGEALIHLGEEVRVFSRIHTNEYLKEYLHESSSGLYLKKYPPKTTTALKHIGRVLDYTHLYLWKPQVIHETFYKKNRTSMKGIPRVVTIHDMIHEIYPELFPLHDPTSVNKRASVERADHVICVSENTKKDLMTYFNVPEQKISVIHHGFRKLPILTKHENRTEMSPYLLYIGKRGGYKNFANFLRAVASDNQLLNDFTIRAIGGGYATNEENELIRELGFKPHTVIFQNGDDEVLSELLTHASAMVYPSLYEGFGFPVLEAMSMHCPVVVSNTSSIPEVAGNAALFFNPLSIEEMAEQIKKVVYSEDVRLEMIRKGAAQCGLFNWNKAAEETREVYRNLIN